MNARKMWLTLSLALIGVALVGWPASGQSGPDSFFDVFTEVVIGPPYPTPPMVVKVAEPVPGGGMIDTEILHLDLRGANPPEMGLHMAGTDSGGGGVDYGVESFFDIFFDVSPQAPDFPAESFFDVFVELKMPDGQPAHLAGPVKIVYPPPESFFDVFFDVSMPGGDILQHHVHGELNPAQPLTLREVRTEGGGQMFDSFFDIFFEIDLNPGGELDPSQPLLNMTMTGNKSVVPEPGALPVLALGGLGLLAARRRRT